MLGKLSQAPPPGRPYLAVALQLSIALVDQPIDVHARSNSPRSNAVFSALPHTDFHRYLRHVKEFVETCHADQKLPILVRRQRLVKKTRSQQAVAPMSPRVDRNAVRYVKCFSRECLV